MSLTKNQQSPQDIQSKLIAKGWYSLPWGANDEWYETVRFPEFDCQDWQFWGLRW